MAKLRGNLGKRQQDKETAVQLRMRQHQVLVGKDLIVVEEKVQVQDPVLIAADPLVPQPAKPLFQGQETLQQFAGWQCGAHQAGGVDEPVAADHPHRFAPKGTGQGAQSNAGLAPQGLPRIKYDPQGVAQV